MDEQENQERFKKEIREIQQRLGATNVFLFIFEPEAEKNRVVCGGDLDLETSAKLLNALSILQERILKNVQDISRRVIENQNHLSN